MQFALPHIMGWDQITNQQSRGTVGLQGKGDSQVLDLEWEKWVAAEEYEVDPCSFCNSILYIINLKTKIARGMYGL